MADDGFPPTARFGGRFGAESSGQSPTRPKNVRAKTELTIQAAQLRAAGATFREIGEALKIDHTTARTYVLRALRDAAYEAADLMRTQEGQRLDRLQRAHWQAAVGGDTDATRVVLRIMERRARLFGLDAPQRVEVADVPADHNQMDAELRVILGQLEKDVPELGAE